MCLVVYRLLRRISGHASERSTASNLSRSKCVADLAWGAVASAGRLAPIAGPGPRPRYFFPYPNLLRAPTKPPVKDLSRLESHKHLPAPDTALPRL